MRIQTTAIAALALMLGTSSAFAQNCGKYGGYVGAGDPKESVTVAAPTLRSDRTRLNTPPGRVRLSTRVSYADLDLCSDDGAAALRQRVRATASDLCDQIDAAHPHTMNGPRSCYRDALSDAQPRVDFAIGDARGTR